MTGNSPNVLTTASAGKALVPPLKVIEQIATKGLSGCLTVNDPQDASVSWHLYATGGQLNYATSVKGKAERLQCLLQRTQPGLAGTTFLDGQNEYSTICQWGHVKGLPMAGLRQLLARLSLEAVVQIIALPQATVEFNKTVKVDPILISTPLNQLPAPILQLGLQWQQWRPAIFSPFTRIYLELQDQPGFQETWERQQKVAKVEAEGLFSLNKLPVIIRTLRQQLSIYRSAHLMEVQPQTLAAWIKPFVTAKLIKSLSYETFQPLAQLESAAAVNVVEREIRPVIACIDDSKTIQRQVRGILEMSGYDVLSITEPTQALTSLVRQKPAVILMDVNMPDIDGYELCGMLRQSKQLRDIPIMMLTGRDGILDRLKARTLGVTYYLTKPFNPERLLDYVQRLLQSTSTQHEA